MSWQIDSSFLFLAAILYYLDREGLFLWLVLFCVLHELGHWGGIRLLGGRVVRLRFSCAGAEMGLSAARPLSPKGMVLAALAGPGVNLTLALLTGTLARWGAGERLYLLAGINLALGGLNMLPIRWLDGGRAVTAALAALGWEDSPLPGAVSLLTAGAVLGVGVLLLRDSGGRNFSLLLVGSLLLLMTLRERKKEGDFFEI